MSDERTSHQTGPAKKPSGDSGFSLSLTQTRFGLFRRFEATALAAEDPFCFATTGVQDGLSVTVRLHFAFKDQITSRLECNALIEIRCHVAVSGVTCVLSVYHGCHALENFHNLLI